MKIFSYVWKIKFSHAFLISALPLVLLASLCLKAAESFLLYKGNVYPQMPLNSNTVRFFLKTELQTKINKLTAPKVSTESDLKTFSIYIDQEKIDKLNSDLPSSGQKEYESASLEISDGTTFDKVKLRYRGSSSSHWMYEQKSLRIKLEDGFVYDFDNVINLINPPYSWSIVESVNYDIARELGLLAPECYPVRVFINGRYLGVYLYLSQINEATLRKTKLMPGSIYYGERAMHKDGIAQLWNDADSWTKEASRNLEEKENRDDIELLTTAVRDYSNLDFYNFVNTYIDKAKFYNYFALDVIFNTNHHDYGHNHKLYFDPYKGKFEPIEWDLRFWSQKNQFKDASVYHFLNKISLNPVLEMERDKVTYDLMNSQILSKDSLMARLYSYKDLIYDDLKSDPYKDEAISLPRISKQAISVPFDMDTFEKKIEDKRDILTARQNNLSKIFDDLTAQFSYQKNAEGANLIFKVDGNSGAYVNLVDLFASQQVKIYRDTNFNQILDESDVLLTDNKEMENELINPGRKVVPGTINNWPKNQYGDTHIVPAPLFYSYIIQGATPEDISKINATNCITGKPVEVEKSDFAIEDEADSIHPWLLPTPESKTVSLAGKINVDEELVFDENTTVTIEPGTTFIMAPGTSVYFYGKVVAEGTAKAPIVFKAKDKKKPWGSIVVQGEKANDSSFYYLQFADGSTTSRNLINYTAQFNIHDVDNFTLKNCDVGINYVGDDSMHIAYSSGQIEGCSFHDARSDAVDIDISNITISNSIFNTSGNDLLDLMTSQATIQNNIFVAGGDKGISVGEWSHITVSNNIFLQNNIGIEIKDKSEALLEKSVILDSISVPINLYYKNFYYGEGGFLKLKQVNIVGDKTDITLDAKSEIEGKENVIYDYPSLDDFSFLNSWIVPKNDWAELKDQLILLKNTNGES